MSALYIAGEALGLSQEKVQALVKFALDRWLLSERVVIQQYLQAKLLPEQLINTFLATFDLCSFQKIDHLGFCETLWSDQQALYALSLLVSFDSELAKSVQQPSSINDTMYNQAIDTLVKTSLANQHIPSLQFLTQSVAQHSTVFFCSSAGDTQLALDTAKALAAKHHSIFFPLTETAESILDACDDLDHMHIIQPSCFEGEDYYSSKTLTELQLAKITSFLQQLAIKPTHAVVGMPSPVDEQKAMQLAVKLPMPCTFVSEFLFTPPQQHSIWQHAQALQQNERVNLAVPLNAVAQLFSVKPVKVIGHRSLQPVVAVDQTHANQQICQRMAVQGDDYTLVSGTTQPHEVDVEFLTILLAALQHHPSMQLRVAIHPGVSELPSYLDKLLDVCEQHPALAESNRVAIIYSQYIETKVSQQNATPTQLQRFEASQFLLRCEVSGPDAAQAATRVAQAVPGALTNTSVMQGKPTLYNRERGQSNLPDDWFVGNPLTLFSKVRVKPHSLAELGLDPEVSAGESLAALVASSQ